MDDFNKRQITHFSNFIQMYQQGEISLNSLVQKLEGLLAVITDENVNGLLEECVHDLEILNALSLDSGEKPPAERVQALLKHLLGLIKQLLP